MLSHAVAHAGRSLLWAAALYALAGCAGDLTAPAPQLPAESLPRVGVVNPNTVTATNWAYTYLKHFSAGTEGGTTFELRFTFYGYTSTGAAPRHRGDHGDTNEQLFRARPRNGAPNEFIRLELCPRNAFWNTCYPYSRVDWGGSESGVEKLVPYCTNWNGGGGTCLTVKNAKVRLYWQPVNYAVDRVTVGPANGGTTTTWPGASTMYDAVAWDSNNQQIPGWTVTNWQSSNPAVATVGTDGLVVGRSYGTTTISANVSDKTGSVVVTVGPPPPPPAAPTVAGMVVEGEQYMWHVPFVHWTTVSGALGYVVYRAGQDGHFVEIARLADPNATSWTDQNSNVSSYWGEQVPWNPYVAYRVRAYNAAAYSADSRTLYFELAQ